MEGKMQPLNGQPSDGAPTSAQAEPPAGRGPAAPALTEFVVDDVVYSTLLTRKFRQRKAWRPIDPHLVIAAIPGQILQLNVKIGERVTRGQSLLVLEAMKMQNQILSPLAGTVVAIRVQVGQKVAKGELMLELKD
jgi:glutaconyl-CoA/methylmalonyl-CoA decarboxylase subunit gamma